MVRALGHNSRGPEVFTCLLCLLRGMRLAVFVCLFVVVGWFSFFFFSFFFFEVQRNEERGGKKSSHLFLQETKFQESLYGSLSTGIGSERQNNNFLPFSLILHTRKKKFMEINPEEDEEGGWGVGEAVQDVDLTFKIISKSIFLFLRETTCSLWK